MQGVVIETVLCLLMFISKQIAILYMSIYALHRLVNFSETLSSVALDCQRPIPTMGMGTLVVSYRSELKLKTYKEKNTRS